MYVGDWVLWIYRFLRGYLKITVRGECSERVLNLCAANRISLWNSRIIKNGIETCLFIGDFRLLREIIRGSKLRVHILKKAGLPIKLSKNRKRVGIFAGVILLFVFLKFMSGYIWIIDVEGNRQVNENDIIEACRKIGIKEGISADSVDPKIQREQLLLELDSLAWASLNVEGSRLTVNVSEIKGKGKEEDCPTNLKAKADGIIKKINVTSGNCLVKTGDTVKKGDILVSGVIEASDGTKFVKSAGSITAVTTDSITAEGKYREVKQYETGETKCKSVLEFFTYKIPLFLGGETSKYNSVTKVKQFELFGQSLPIRLYKKEFRFIREETVELSKEELTEKLREEISLKLKDEGAEYEIVSEEIKDTEKGLKIIALAKRETDITTPEAMLIAEAD